MKSTRGVYGGYQLAKSANKVSLLEIIEAIDGPIGANQDIELPGMSNNIAATLESALAAIESDVRKRLRSVTLASLRFSEAA